MKYHYRRPIDVRVASGRLVIEIGIHTLAHAIAYADWSNPFDEERDDYIRTFAIEDPEQFAKDVQHAMLNEREDGSTPLSDFLDKMAEAAVNDGSLGLAEDEQIIKHGEFSPLEKWAAPSRGGDMKIPNAPRFWLSWVQPTEDHRPLTDPPHASVIGWWCSGYDSNDRATLCALVAARTLSLAKAAVRTSWPEAPSARSEWRIEQQHASTWLPGDRFPLGDGWMKQRAEDSHAD